jgi:rhodanese-related sulfurtransferase
MRAFSTPQVFARVRILAAVAACTGASLLVGCSKSISDRDIQPISLAEVRALTQAERAGSVLLIDPRSPAAYARGHIPGARNMRLETVSDQEGIDPALERYSALVVYGEDPGTGTGRAMTKRLMTIGYKNVRLFFGGMNEWSRAGLEVRSGDGAAANP